MGLSQEEIEAIMAEGEEEVDIHDPNLWITYDQLIALGHTPEEAEEIMYEIVKLEEESLSPEEYEAEKQAEMMENLKYVGAVIGIIIVLILAYFAYGMFSDEPQPQQQNYDYNQQYYY